MKPLKFLITLLTMTLMGQTWATDVDEEKVKALEEQSHKTYISIIADHKRVGLTETMKREIGDYYRGRRQKRNDVCGFRQDFPCHYKLEQETYKVLKTYQETLIQYKKDNMDVRKVPPIEYTKVYIGK